MTVALDDFRKLGEVLVRGSANDHFHALGLSVEYVRQGGVIFKLRYHRELVGNPDQGIVHGGAITALLDSACGFAAGSTLDELGFTPTIDLRIDYVRSAEPNKDIFAEAEVYRATPNIIFTRGVAYQEDKSKPIAYAVGNFMRLESGSFGNFLDSVRKHHAALPPEVADGSVAVEPDYTPPERLIADLANEARKAGKPQRVLDAIPYAGLLGINVQVEDDGFLFHLPPRPTNIGNPILPALHGGALGGFMEMSAILHLSMSMDETRLPKVIDFSIDYLRAGLYQDTYAKCEIIRFGGKVVNIDITAWQADDTKPIARARGQFLVA